MRIQYARKNSTQIEVLQGVNAETQKKKEEEREKRRRRKLAQRQAAAVASAVASGTVANPAGVIACFYIMSCCLCTFKQLADYLIFSKLLYCYLCLTTQLAQTLDSRL